MSGGQDIVRGFVGRPRLPFSVEYADEPRPGQPSRDRKDALPIERGEEQGSMVQQRVEFARNRFPEVVV
jgi:hypothetical protein